jgi:hypothetical protein
MAIPRPLRQSGDVRGFQYLAVILCTLAVFALGLVALLGPWGSGAQTEASTECSPPQTTTWPTAKLTVVPNVLKAVQPGTSNSIFQAGMLLCRAGLNQTIPNLPAAHPGEKGEWTVVSQSPAPGSRVPVGSSVVTKVRKS